MTYLLVSIAREQKGYIYGFIDTALWFTADKDLATKFKTEDEAKLFLRFAGCERLFNVKYKLIENK